MYLVPLESFTQFRATQQASLYYLHIKQSPIYNQNDIHAIVVQFRLEHDLRAALNPSTVSVDVYEMEVYSIL